jgi:hypothetical protein
MKNWVKELVSNAGLLVLIGGVVHLGHTVYFGSQTNTTLAISAGLVIGGVILYIILNKLIK